MATRDKPWKAGTPCWADLAVDDVDSARLFYEGLFGWQFTDPGPEAGGYLMATKDGRHVAGLGPKQDPSQPSVWTTYLASDDADATASKIVANGGQVMVPPMDVMAAGRMLIGVDVGGAAFGVWQAGEHTGAQVVNEPGAVVWNENMSRSWEANQAFYAGVFGYEYGDMSSDGFRCATIKVGGADVGGIGEISDDMPAELPAHWTTYFAVADTDEAVDELVKLGGNLIQPPWDTPFGRMAIVSDGQAATFSIVSAPAAGYGAAADAVTATETGI